MKPKPKPVDLEAVRAAMLALEDQSDDERSEVPTGEALAKILGVEWSEAFDVVITGECLRSLKLLRGHYAKVGVAVDPLSIAAIAFLQGATFAQAVAQIRGTDGT